MTMMNNLTNENRQLDLKLTMASSKDQVPDLVIGRMVGQELLGRPYEYVHSLFTQDSQNERLPNVLTQQEMGGLIGGTACVMLDYDPRNNTLGKRYFHGQIAAIRFKGPVPKTGMCQYEAIVRPKIAMLKISQDYRIFLNKGPLEMIEMILENAGLEKNTDFKFDLSGDFGTRSQTIQYEESDENFVQRLMEDVGLSYYFEHQENRHVMIITDQDFDADNIYTACPDYGRGTENKVNYLWPGQIMNGYRGIDVYEFAYENSTQTIEGSFIHHRNANHNYHVSKKVWDYNFAYADNVKQFRKRYYPFGHYVEGTQSGQWEWTGDSEKDYGLANIMQARERANADVYMVEGNDRCLQCGYSFEMTGHPAEFENKTVKLITEARYEIYAESFPHITELFGSKVSAYRAYLKVQPTQEGSSHVNDDDPRQPFVLPFEAYRPKIAGVQCARVIAIVTEESEEQDTGSEHADTQEHDAGSEHADSSEHTEGSEHEESGEASEGTLDSNASHKSVDAGPYVSVRLKMDWSDPASALDGNNPHQVTDYVRVSQFWAGKGRGALFTPRVGDEVLVAFIGGDPDYPIVVGSAYNSINEPFMDPQHEGLISGIRSRVQTEEGIALPSSYEGSRYGDLFFNDEESSENTGLTLRICGGGSEAEYELTEKGENYNYTEGAAGLILKSPEETKKLILALNAGDDTQTMYSGNIDYNLRNIKTIVGDVVSTTWNTFTIAHFAVTVGTKAIVSVTQMTPNAIISSSLGGNTIRSFVGANEVATGLRSPAAALELGVSLGEWVLLLTGKATRNDKEETAQMTAEIMAMMLTTSITLNGIITRLGNPEIAKGNYTEIMMAPGILEAECKNSEGEESEIKMSPKLFKFETEGEEKESKVTITPGNIKLLAKDEHESGLQIVSHKGMESRFIAATSQSSLKMCKGSTQISQTGTLFSNISLSGAGNIISQVSPAVDPPEAGIAPAIAAAAIAAAAEQVANAAENQAGGVEDMATVAQVVVGVPAGAGVAAAAAEAGDDVAEVAEDAAADADAGADAAVHEAAAAGDIANRAAPAGSQSALLPTGVNINAGPEGGALLLNDAMGAIRIGGSVIAAQQANIALVAPEVSFSGAMVQLNPPEPPAAEAEAAAVEVAQLAEVEEVAVMDAAAMTALALAATAAATVFALANAAFDTEMATQDL